MSGVGFFGSRDVMYTNLPTKEVIFWMKIKKKTIDGLTRLSETSRQTDLAIDFNDSIIEKQHVLVVRKHLRKDLRVESLVVSRVNT